MNVLLHVGMTFCAEKKFLHFSNGVGYLPKDKRKYAQLLANARQTGAYFL